jgi:iron complex outermembrane receptor protein
LRLQSALIHSLLLAGLATSTQARAQSDASIEEASQTFQLGTVDVRDNRDAVSGDEQRLGASEMRLRNADTVADAVRQLPGATLSRNSRNEEMIYLRGFDPRQVPVFVDGVPLYVPYDGYVDFGPSPPSTCPRSAWPRPAPR